MSDPAATDEIHGSPTAAELAAALLEPLSGVNDELRLSLSSELEQRIENAPEPVRGAAARAEALAQIRKARAASAAPGRRWKLAVLLTALAAMVAWALMLFLPGLQVLRASIGWRLPWESSVSEVPLRAMLRPDSRWQPKYLSAPGYTEATWPWDENDPVLYFSACLDHEGPLPADFDAVRERLAPGNAAWPMAAAWHVDTALTAAQRKAEFQRLRAEAAAMPEFDCYQIQRRNFMLESFRTPRSFPEAWLMQAHANTPVVRMDLLISGEQKRGAEAYKTGNATGGAAAFENSQRLRLSRLRAIAHQGGKALLKFSFADPPAPKRGPVPEPILRYRQREEQLAQLAGRVALPFDVEEPAIEQSMCGCSGPLPGQSFQSIAGPLEGAAKLFTAQAMLLGLAGVFLTAAVGAWVRLLPWPSRGSRVARGFMPLLTPCGTVLILFHGVVLPLIWVALWLPYFHTGRVEEYGQAVVLAPGLLCVVAMIHAAGREVYLRTRVAGLGHGWGFKLLRWLPLLCAYALIPFACFSDLSGDALILFCLGLASFWLLAKFSTGFYFFLNGDVRQSLIARAMLPALLVATALVVLPVPFLHFAEGGVAASVIGKQKEVVYNPEAIRLADQLWQEWGYGK